jgi:hypothetical protein
LFDRMRGRTLTCASTILPKLQSLFFSKKGNVTACLKS